MAVVTAFLVVGLACAIAAGFVIREAARMAAEPPPPVYDLEEAYEWVVDRLPDVVAATVTPDDVRLILDVQAEHLRALGAGAETARVLGAAEMIDDIVERAAARGERFLPEQVAAVVDTQLEYLRDLGAVGPPADPPTAS
ncbi:MAG: hypothetical protein ACKOBG_07905 [Actinomycetota bacterium]